MLPYFWRSNRLGIERHKLVPLSNRLCPTEMHSRLVREWEANVFEGGETAREATLLYLNRHTVSSPHCTPCHV